MNDRMPDFLIDLLKIVGGVVRDGIDFGDYRITILIEKKIDDKQGIVIDSVSVDKRMSLLEVQLITNRLKELINKRYGEYKGK